MLRLSTGDWQLESRPPCDRKDANGKSIRFQENLEAICEMIKMGYDLGCRGLDHGGDLSEEKNPEAAVYTAAAKAFRYAIDLGYEDVAGDAGNHDGAIYSQSSSSMEPFTALHPQIKFFHEPTWVENRLYLPYLHEKSPAEVGAILAEICKGKETIKNPILLAHYAYAGCTIGARNMILPGDKLGRGQIPSMFKLGLFAHIHKQQVIEDNGLTVVFQGSPVICDHGERNDPKGFAIYDTETGKYTLHQLKPRRRWVEATWPLAMPAVLTDTQPWDATDIVKIVGTRDAGADAVRTVLQKAFKEGRLVEPFFWRDTTSLASQERVVRAEDVTSTEGLKGSVVAFFGKQWPEPTEAHGKAQALVLDALQEAKPVSYSQFVRPAQLTAVNWMSWPKMDVTFREGTPTLIQGRNGVGKTNLIEALLFCMTGQVSKRLRMASLVRQGQKETKVSLLLKGDQADFLVQRSVNISSKGSALQKVKLTMRKLGEETWTSLADGGVSDTQAVLRQIVGATYESLRATRFAFQGDLSPFLGAEPSERKAVLAEIIGLDPIAKAFKEVNERKNAVAKLHGDAKASLAGMTAVYDPDALGRAEAVLAQAEKATAEAEANQGKAQTILNGAKEREDVAKGALEEQERQLQALPNVAAELATLEQALASENEAYSTSRDSVNTRIQTAKARIEALPKDPQKALQEAQDGLPGLEKAVQDLSKALEAATAEHTQAEVNRSSKKTVLDTKTAAVNSAGETYKKTREALVGRYQTANNKAKILEAAKPAEALATLVASLPALTKAATDAATAAGAAQTEFTSATAAEAVAQTNLSAATNRLAGFKDVVAGDCSRCGQTVTAEHLAKEKADAQADLDAAQAQLPPATAKAKTALTALQTAQAAEKAAAKALADAETKKASLERDVTDLGTAIKDRDAIKAEGEKLTADYEAVKKENEEELAKLAAEVLELEPALATAAAVKAKAAEALAVGQQAVQARKEAIASLERTITDLAQAQKDLDAVMAESNDLNTAHDKKVRETQDAITAKQARVAEVDRQRRGLEEMVRISREAGEKLATARAEAQASLDSFDRITKLAAENKVSATAQITSLKETARKIKEVEEKERKLAEDAEVLSLAADALNPRTGLPVFLIDAKLAFLEDRINVYMTRLGMPGLRVSLTTLDGDKETMAVLVDNGMEPRLDVNAYSGGQRDRIEMAVKQALTDLAETTLDVRLGLLAWDEPGGYLDEEGKTSLVQIAYEKSGNGEAPVALVISHDRRISASFDNRLFLGEDEEGGTVVS